MKCGILYGGRGVGGRMSFASVIATSLSDQARSEVILIMNFYIPGILSYFFQTGYDISVP